MREKHRIAMLKLYFRWNFGILDKIWNPPINPLDLINANNWSLVTFAKATKSLKLTRENIYHFFGEYSFCYYSAKHKTYVICYNENLNEEDFRRSLAHEIGHIFYRHIFAERETLMHVNEIELAVLDEQANFFADYILREGRFVGVKPSPKWILILSRFYKTKNGALPSAQINKDK